MVLRRNQIQAKHYAEPPLMKVQSEQSKEFALEGCPTHTHTGTVGTASLLPINTKDHYPAKGMALLDREIR